jgi:formylmethanofuran dehydrogenase subunit B
LKLIKDATCTFCGCVRDDIDLTVQGHKILKAERACVLANGWFLNHEIEERPACLIQGQPTPRDSLSPSCARRANYQVS